MAQPFHELLAESLRKAIKIANHSIVQTAQLSRIDRERLIRGGCLQPIIRSWYLICPPDTDTGESTLWHINFWDFVRLYLEDRFGKQYCLSPETSMDLWLGKNYLPRQAVVMVNTGGTQSLNLPHHTSLLIYQENKNFPTKMAEHHGLNVFPFEYALCRMPSAFYSQQPAEAEIALALLDSPDRVLYYLLKDGMVAAAERIAGASRHLKKVQFADAILSAMRAAGFNVTEKNPFREKPLLGARILPSPYSARIAALWEKSRAAVVARFPEPDISAKEIKYNIKEIDSIYVQDAYHSLSIEGYQVSEELIAKIAQGSFRPESNESDRLQKNAMAAKGYYEAFKKVKSTLVEMSKSDAPVRVLKAAFSEWYLALFSPAVLAGIIPREQLAGFRHMPVYIRHAAHVPPPYYAVPDCMETLFQCAAHEPHPAVRAVLIHWLTGFIHPWVDGNGRMARFAMNALLVSGGYPWTIIHVENRKNYLDALEKASVGGDIQPFADLIANECQRRPHK